MTDHSRSRCAPRRRAITTAALIVALLTPLAAPAGAGPLCGSRAEIVQTLQGQFAESRRVAAIGLDGNLYEWFVSETNDTWTMLVTTPSGASCAVAAGESWHPVTTRKQDQGS